MINWTEEDVNFVCNTMIVPAMERMIQFVNTAYDSNHKSIEALVNAFDKISYQHTREIAFLKAIIVQYCHLDPEKLAAAHEEYIKQYDELSKEVLHHDS